MLTGAMFSDWLISFRREKRLTLRNVSELTGISVSRLSAIERGQTPNPSLAYFVKFAQALHYKRLSDFIGEIEG